MPLRVSGLAEEDVRDCVLLRIASALLRNATAFFGALAHCADARGKCFLCGVAIAGLPLEVAKFELLRRLTLKYDSQLFRLSGYG